MGISELKKRIQIELPDDKIDAILYHSSYQPQDSYLLKRNKEYVSWGRSIMDAAYATYIYRNENLLSVGDLSKKISTFYRYILDAVYDKFMLEDFVLKSKGELTAKHTDIVAKLVVVIYQECGFLKVYDFLYPFFGNASLGDSADYKALVQEYAQARKLIPQYVILDIKGPEHEKHYACQLKIGKQVATAEAIGKKGAEKEVARQFANKYNISALAPKTTGKRERKPICPMAVQRKKQLDDVIKLLNLQASNIKYSQIDEVFTHSSYSNQNRKLALNSNDCLAVVGANILLMLCGDYIFENYNMDNVSLVAERGILLNEANLAKALPTSITRYLLAAGEVENNFSAKANDRLKIDILKSVLAVLWLNYETLGNIEIEKSSREFAYRMLEKSSDDKVLDYRTFLQIIVQKYEYTFNDECQALENSTENNPVYKAKIRVESSEWFVEGDGYGSDKKSARNNAAKDLLPLLLPYCSEDSELKDTIYRMLDPETLFLYETKKKGQPIKNVKLPDNENQASIVPSTPGKAREAKKDVEPPKKKTSIPKEVSFDNASYVLYICKGTITCRKNNHNIVSVTGILASLGGRPIKLNVNYCTDCELFFINYSEYKYYRDIYGALLGNFSVQESPGHYGAGYESLAEESVLKICGYTVNQTDNISEHQRQLILGNLMDRNIISKNRIIEYIQFFINNSRYRYNMRRANQKWNMDLQWVRSYQIDRQRHFIIDSIKKYY